MGNSPDHLINCVDIACIPSHEPKKVFQWVRAQSIECQMAVIAQGKKKQENSVQERDRPFRCEDCLFPSSSKFFWLCVDCLDSQLLEFPNQKERDSQQINSSFTSDSLQTHRVEAKRQRKQRDSLRKGILVDQLQDIFNSGQY
jgi:hypothetical protein